MALDAGLIKEAQTDFDYEARDILSTENKCSKTSMLVENLNQVWSLIRTEDKRWYTTASF